jgi:hypothetical protein|tara:strand:- start:219 stop:437 length:219 start_codon:yes stop_codon:yes gene_type:complete
MQDNVVKFPSEEGTIELFTRETDEGIPKHQVVKVTMTVVYTEEPMSPETLAQAVEVAKEIIRLGTMKKYEIL